MGIDPASIRVLVTLRSKPRRFAKIITKESDFISCRDYKAGWSIKDAGGEFPHMRD